MSDQPNPQDEFAELQDWLDKGGQNPSPTAPETLALIEQPDSALPYATDLEGVLGARQAGLVILQTGQLAWDEALIRLPGNLPLELALHYRSRDPHQGLFGRHWRFEYEHRLEIQRPGKDCLFIFSDGRRFLFRYDAARKAHIDQGNLGASLGYIPEHHTIELHYDTGKRQYFHQDGHFLGEMDANNNHIELAYDPQGRLRQLCNNSGACFTFHYAGQRQQVSEIRDHGDRRWQFEYAQSTLGQIHRPGGDARRYHYQAHTESNDTTSQLLTQANNGLGHKLVECQYDAAGQAHLIREKQIGSGLLYRYNPPHRTISTQTVDGRTTQYHLNRCGLIDSILHPNEAHHYLRWDADSHTLTRYTHLTEIDQYDERGRLVQQIDAEGQETCYQYQETNPHPASITGPSGTIKNTYDGRHNTLSTTNEKGHTEQYEYNAWGNRTKTIDAEGNITAFAYNDRHLNTAITDAKGNTATTEYDVLGREVAYTDAEGNRIQTTYDPADRITRIIDPLEQAIRFAYDKAGQLRGIADPAGNITQYGYNAKGQIVTQQRPGEREWQYRYHPENGQVSQVTREDGSTIDFAYNEEEQLIRETYHPAPADQIKADQATATPSGQETLADETLTTEYTYDDEGNLCQAKNADSTIGLAYNRLGQLETQNNDGQIIECAYNKGKLTSLRYLDQEITYQRDRQGALQAVQVNDEEAFIQHQYNSQQQLTERQYPNQQGETLSYDETWQLTHIQTAQQDIPYQTDKTGQIIQKGDTRYRYDASSRLVQSGGRHFQYDKNGNLTHQWREGGDTQSDAAQETQSPFTNQYDPANNRLQETETHTFTYDARGNLQSKTHKASGQAVHYIWNLRDQLIRVHGHRYNESTQDIAEIDLHFRYDAVGRRQEKWDAIAQTKRQYLYDQLDIVAIATYEKGQERRITTLVHDDTIDTPLRIQNQYGTFHYHRDHQGSIIALTDEQGEVVERFEYDNDYGAITHHEKITETDNPYVYTGREYDAEDLYYYRARYYDPTIKRFLSEDPIGFLAGDANFYRYVCGDPVNWVDAKGLKRRCPQYKKDRIKKGLDKARKARQLFEAAKVTRTAVRTAVLADLATIEPTDLMPWKWVAEVVAVGATEAAFAVLENNLMDPKELENLKAEDKDCKEREKAAEKREEAAKVEKKNEGRCSKNGKTADHNKGKCAEKLVREHYANKTGHTIMDEALHSTPNMVSGLDHVVTTANTVIFIETKANTASHTEAQKYGDVYRDKQEKDMSEGANDNKGRYKQRTKKQQRDYEKQTRGKKTLYHKCRVKLKYDKTNCYGAGRRGKCKPESKVECSEWKTEN